MLMGHVYFVYQALFFLTESAKTHVLNTMDQTVVIRSESNQPLGQNHNRNKLITNMIERPNFRGL